MPRNKSYIRDGIFVSYILLIHIDYVLTFDTIETLYRIILYAEKKNFSRTVKFFSLCMSRSSQNVSINFNVKIFFKKFISFFNELKRKKKKSRIFQDKRRRISRLFIFANDNTSAFSFIFFFLQIAQMWGKEEA